MRFIHNTRTSPAFNLAAEEWLLRNTDTDIFMLWRNEPAVIVGRNQNTVSEIDEEFVRERGISVIRRLTGGGAVFTIWATSTSPSSNSGSNPSTWISIASRLLSWRPCKPWA